MDRYPFTGLNWDSRHRLIAEWIRPGARVIDFGAGEGNLLSHLRGVDYVPVDKFPCREDGIVADLDGEFPVIPWADIVIAEGLLEYLADPVRALKKFHAYADYLVVSYHTAPAHPDAAAVMDRATFDHVLVGTGWEVQKSKDLGPHQRVYFCKSTL
jgi:hypothetical protein